jgi:hypothetical protein
VIQAVKAVRARLWIAIGLGVISVAGTVLLVAADTIGGGVNWAHHSPASAAPLFLIAAAIAVASSGRPPKWRQALARFVAVLAFAAWGTAQLMHGPAAGALDDAAIMLFVIDGGCLVLTEARPILARHSQATRANPLRRDPGGPHPAASPDDRTTAVRDQAALSCCTRSARPCTCAAALGQA